MQAQLFGVFRARPAVIRRIGSGTASGDGDIGQGHLIPPKPGGRCSKLFRLCTGACISKRRFRRLSQIALEVCLRSRLCAYRVKGRPFSLTHELWNNTASLYRRRRALFDAAVTAACTPVGEIRHRVVYVRCLPIRVPCVYWANQNNTPYTRCLFESRKAHCTQALRYHLQRSHVRARMIDTSGQADIERTVKMRTRIAIYRETEFGLGNQDVDI